MARRMKGRPWTVSADVAMDKPLTHVAVTYDGDRVGIFLNGELLPSGYMNLGDDLDRYIATFSEDELADLEAARTTLDSEQVMP